MPPERLPLSALSSAHTPFSPDVFLTTQTTQFLQKTLLTSGELFIWGSSELFTPTSQPHYPCSDPASVPPAGLYLSTARAVCRRPPETDGVMSRTMSCHCDNRRKGVISSQRKAGIFGSNSGREKHTCLCLEITFFGQVASQISPPRLGIIPQKFHLRGYGHNSGTRQRIANVQGGQWLRALTESRLKRVCGGKPGRCARTSMAARRVAVAFPSLRATTGVSARRTRSASGSDPGNTVLSWRERCHQSLGTAGIWASETQTSLILQRGLTWGKAESRAEVVSGMLLGTCRSSDGVSPSGGRWEHP